MHYDEPYTDQARLTLSSVVLLVIFVGAAGLMLAAVIWRPWFDEDDSSNVTAPVDVPAGQAVAEGAPAAEGAVDPNAVVPVEAADGP